MRIYVPETQIGHITLGQEVPITVDSLPGRDASRASSSTSTSEGEYSPRNLQTADERADQVFATRVGIEDGRRRCCAPGMAAFMQVPR